jgi:O-antigen/teichoic acid export membrane protein
MLHQIAFPAYARIRDDRAAVGRYYLKSVRLVTLVTVPLLFGIAAVAHWGAPLLIGEYWRDSALPISLVALVLPLRAVGTLNSPLLNAIGRTRVNLGNALTTLVVLPLGFWVGCRWGVVGLSASWLVTFPIVFGIMSMQMLRLLDLRLSELARAAAPATVAGTAMLVVVTGVGWLLPEVHDIVALATLIPIGAAVYLGILWTFHRDRLLETVDLVRHRARA